MSQPSLLVPPAPLAAPAVARPAATARGAWAQALARPDFRWRAVLLVLALVGLVGWVIPPFYVYIQQRAGRVLPDPLLHLLPRHNVASLVFLFMYGSVVAAVGWLLRHPYLLMRGLWAYWLLLLFRIGTIWLVPLLPPPGLLSMPDPFTSLVFQALPSDLITKDLFFSGHTATVALLALAVRGRWGRRALALAALAVGVLVLVQRVHYTYDVLAAPCFAWLAYWLGRYSVGRPFRQE